MSKSDAKKSVSWGDTAKKRFIKQHGSIDEIPEGDAHAVPKYEAPTNTPQPSPEEIKAAEDSLTEKINEIKKTSQTPLKPEPKGNNFYDEWID